MPRECTNSESSFSTCAYKLRFIWVKVWLAILLPKDNRRLIITGPELAINLIKEMITTSLPDEQRSEQLRTAYQRLWKQNEYPNHKRSRVHLFRLVLCSKQNLNYKALTQALRVSSGDDDPDHDIITEAVVKSLGDDFLIEESTEPSRRPITRENLAGQVLFVHDSAKAFISQMKDKDVDSTCQSSALAFEAKTNHLYMAKLYITVASQPEHPLWRDSGIDFSKRATRTKSRLYRVQKSESLLELSRISHSSPPPPKEKPSRIVAENIPLGVWLDTITAGLDRIHPGRTRFLSYIATTGLWHCERAVAKTSIFDAIWMEVFSKVARPNNLAFLVASRYKNSTYQWRPYSLFTYQGNNIEPLHASMVARLDIIGHDDFSDLELENLKQSSSHWSDREHRLASLLQADTAISHAIRDQANVLCIACRRGHETTVNFLLSGTYHLRGPEAVLDLLMTPGSGDALSSNFAIVYTLRVSDTTILEILLKFEMAMKQVIEEKHIGETLKAPPKQQWLLNLSGIPCFLAALYISELGEDYLCHLIDIYPPHDVNMQDHAKRTPLHYAATHGYLRLVHKLVKDCGARTDIKDKDGDTALDDARREEQHACIEYLESVDLSEGFSCFRKFTHFEPA
jgi:hypothetical protein